jgi:hypothetical protein
MRAKLLAAVGHLPEGSSGAAKETPALAFFCFAHLKRRWKSSTEFANCMGS